MKKILLLFILILFTFQSKASHLMGGEITWECLKSGPNVGQYIFTLKVYRDCSGITISTGAQTIQVWGHPTINAIVANFVLQQDVSPPCDGANSGNIPLDCASGSLGAVEEYIFQSAPITLPGVPMNTGWHFTWDECCRNPAIVNILNPSSAGFTLRASMYPFTDPVTGIITPADPCFDSSPSFKEQPKTILCVGFPFSYSHNASDADLDSLVYSWGEPLDDMLFGATTYNPGVAPTFLPFNAPYSVNIPLPGNPTLDSQTGEVSYNANLAGNYVTCVKVEAYKCSQLVAEVYREVQVVLISCPPMPGGGGIPNNPPNVAAPFVDTTTMLASYETTVYAGELVTFNIEGVDGDLYNGTVSQNLTMEVSGGQFASDYTTTTNCLNPPCATFESAVTGAPPPFSSPGIVSGVFTWQTACTHIAAIGGCGATSNVFTFLIKVYDDFCPANGVKFATIKVTVLPAPVDNSPDVRCVSVLSNNEVELTWEHLASAPPSTVYSVFHSVNPNGPYTLLDSLDYPLNSYIHTGNNFNNSMQYYYVTSHSSCADESDPSDTLSTILLDANAINNATEAVLNWNSIHSPFLLTSLPDYIVYAEVNNGLYQEVGSTVLNIDSVLAMRCSGNQKFYIELEDQSGCFSRSSVATVPLQDINPPDIPVINDVSVNSLGQSVITWNPSSIDVDIYEIYILTDEDWLWIGQVNAPDTFLVYNNSNANNVSETFSVRALDSCDNASLKSIEHNSIRMTTRVDVCNFTLNIDWNDYINIANGLDHYKIYITETDEFGIITNNIIRINNETEYILNNINEGSNYYIYVDAYNSDSTIMARSNQLNEPILLPLQPSFNYIESATINHDNDAVEITCLVDNNAIIDHYDVFRSLGLTNNFDLIGNTIFNGESTISYIDNTANTQEEFYQYIIYPVDTCGVRLSPPPFSDIAYVNDTSYAQTMNLKTKINLDYPENSNLLDEYTNTLNFNEYEEWLGSVSEYRLYRSINREPFSIDPLYVWDRINNPDEELLFIDIVTEYGDGNGRFCYYIEAIEGNNTPYNAVISLSNISCVSQTPIIFIPSVFTPNGDEHNEVFYPITYYVSEIGYSFTIYNRHGIEVFTTDNPSKGWDGNFQGNPVQNGNYVYHLQFINGVGELTEKRDIVTLIR